MFDFHTINEFSRTYCIAICAFLVPANLLTAITVMVLTALNRPRLQIWKAAGIGNLFASVMIFHVFSWFAVGVVMAPTYILLLLGSTCLSINLWAIAHPSSMMRLLRAITSLLLPQHNPQH